MHPFATLFDGDGPKVGQFDDCCCIYIYIKDLWGIEPRKIFNEIQRL